MMDLKCTWSVKVKSLKWCFKWILRTFLERFNFDFSFSRDIHLWCYFWAWIWYFRSCFSNFRCWKLFQRIVKLLTILALIDHSFENRIFVFKQRRRMIKFNNISTILYMVEKIPKWYSLKVSRSEISWSKISKWVIFEEIFEKFSTFPKTIILSELIMVFSRWAMVRTVQCSNSELIVSWITESVFGSTFAVASSTNKIELFFKMALPRHNSCFWPTLKNNLHDVTSYDPFSLPEIGTLFW